MSSKPKLIFVKNIEKIYPFIVFAADYRHRLEGYVFDSYENFAETLDQFIQYKDEFDFFIYTTDGLKPLHFENVDSSLFFEWNVKPTGDNSLEVTLLCKNSDIFFSSFVPLGHKYIIDLHNNSIVTLSPTSSFYKQLHDTFIGLVRGKILSTPKNGFYYGNSQHIGMILRGVTSDYKIIKQLKKYHYCSTFLGANVSLSEFNDCILFQDSEPLSFDRHVRIVDLQGNPSTQLGSLEKQIIFRYQSANKLIFDCSLFGLNSHRYFYKIESWRYFIKLINLVLQQNKSSIIIQIISEFIKNFFDNSLLKIDKIVKKELSSKLNFLSASNKNKIIRELFSFHSRIQQRKLIQYCYTQKMEPEHTITSEKELPLAMLTLIEYCYNRNLNFELMTSTVVIEADTSILTDLFAYACEAGVALYVNNKKALARTFDIEIDIDSGEDWFSITPDFYEKDILLTKDEWQKFLGIYEDYYEFDNEVHLFDAKTSSMLQLLRNMSEEYRKNQRKKMLLILKFLDYIFLLYCH